MRHLTNGGESSPAHHFLGFERAVLRRDLPPPRSRGAVKCRVFCCVPPVPNAGLTSATR
jgi:hypothetical protein